MINEKYPESGQPRKDEALKRRMKQSDLVKELTAHKTANNGDNEKFSDTRLMAFTKGLSHDKVTGFVDQTEYDTFVTALTGAGTVTETMSQFEVPTATTSYFELRDPGRVWESPLAGLAYENEGPDPDDVSMAPAPKYGESELCAEIAEVYAMAIVRDMPFSKLAERKSALTFINAEGVEVEFQKLGKPANVADLLGALNSLTWFDHKRNPTTTLGVTSGLTSLESARRNARGNHQPKLSEDSLFRGSSPGCKYGPYISQFLLQGSGSKGPGGTDHAPKSGKVAFGAQTISQKIWANSPGIDWMTNWREWLAIQNGENLSSFAKAIDSERFVTTPRDLATFVHVDQLYQAYFVACLSLLNNNVPNDPGFPEANENGTRAPFATFGGPHILSQMTEVASRALRAVRRQKFQIHRRARPERLGAIIAVAASSPDPQKVFGSATEATNDILEELGLKSGKKPISFLMDWVNTVNENRADFDRGFEPNKESVKSPIKIGKNYLLPMAFPEGSPMHPAYGAGHATVAGACTTILKAFFGIYNGTENVDANLDQIEGLKPTFMDQFEGLSNIYVPKPDGSELIDKTRSFGKLTIEGELNKLAANIAIGRNFAGVHFYTDYFDSLRMGERIAVKLLQEHSITHPEHVSMHLRSFDGDNIQIKTEGEGHADIFVWDADGHRIELNNWWNRHTKEFPSRLNEENKTFLVSGSSKTHQMKVG